MSLPLATREAGLRRLDEFLPAAGKYARSRNFDFGPSDRSNVSTLSPYLRTRLVTEEEVCRAVLDRFARSTVDKFLQEVAWRTYWKGWLEMRPEAWTRYRSTLVGLERSSDYEAAITGQTGIECFDAWSRELIETGYLHNHTRMWFASIWIFTLRLPWQLGAEFFLRHLLDGDPASNTLSWRWVAGLHTRGKHYLARASNIRKFTGGRCHPVGQLDESAQALPPDGEFERQTLDLPENPRPEGRVGLLLIPDDLSALAVDFILPAEIHPTAGWFPDDPGSLGDPSQKVIDFHRGALDDALARAGGQRLTGKPSESVREWATREKLDAIIMTRPTVGPWRDLFAGFDPGIPVHEEIHGWDRRLWPHATAGFFKLKKRLPKFFDALASGQRSLL